MISIVIPIRNERSLLPELYRRLTRTIEATGVPFEIVFVDDGSDDGSIEILQEFRRESPAVKILELSRSFGHQMAIAAGLDCACGEAVITMDGDLQHPPELIPRMLEKWRAGYDIVSTCRIRTAGTEFFKDVTSRWFYRWMNGLSGLGIPEGAADFRLLSREVADIFRRLDERILFLRGLTHWVGFRQATLPYEAPARSGGVSKYSVRSMMRLAIEGLLSFSAAPLYLAASVGVLLVSVGGLALAGVLFLRLANPGLISGDTFWGTILFFLGSLILFVLSIQGVYIGHMYAEVKKRPRYLIRRRYGFQDEREAAGRT